MRHPDLLWTRQGGSSKFSQIAAPLTLMLKTSSTDSAELKKGVVGVGGSGRNRTEPVGKHEGDGGDNGGHDDGGSRSSDFDKRFHPKLHGDFDVTFKVTRWRSGHCASAKMLAFDCMSEANHQELVPITLD